MSLWLVLLIVAVLIVFILITRSCLCKNPVKSIENKHVVITGASSGIGKCAAIIAAKRGANVTLIARNTEKLEACKNEVLKACKYKDKQKVEYLSLDVGESYEKVERALTDIEKTMGPIYMLINCAGTAICGKIEDTTPEVLHELIGVNFLGTYYCTKAVVPTMKASREGIIVLTSSQAGLLGIFGYSAYCSTKFAIRGLAESIFMELKPHNISITLCLPPDTDTPGFANEELTKPLETKLISQSSELVSPEIVAEKLFKDALAGKYFSTVGFEGFMLITLCSGMSPFISWAELFIQSILMGIFRIVSGFYLNSFHKIIVNCMNTRDLHKKHE